MECVGETKSNRVSTVQWPDSTLGTCEAVYKIRNVDYLVDTDHSHAAHSIHHGPKWSTCVVFAVRN